MASYDDTATVSGSVVSFPNGADDVPTKSLVVTIPPTLTGVSSVSVTQTGRNLLDTAIAETKENNSVYITCDGNGKYTATGTATGGSANITFTLKTPCTIKSGMYLHLMNNGTSGSVSITLQKQDNTSILYFALSPANRIADLSSFVGQTIYSIRFYIANGASFEMSLTPMICFSSTETTFEPYQTPTVYTANLGRTIHGGTADIVKGTGEELVKKKTISSFNGTYGAVNNGYAYYIVDADTTHTTSAVDPSNMIANQLFTYGSVARGSAPTWQYGGNDGNNPTHTFILPSDYDTLAKANNFLASLQTPLEVTLTLATPTDFTFDGQEINTRLGYNAFWSDQGNTELTYYKSGYGFTSVTVNRTGKNLFDKNAVTNNTWIVVDGTATESATGYRTSSYIPVKANTRYYVSTKSSNRSAYYDKNGNGIAYFAFSGGTSFNSLYDGYIRITIKNDIDLDTFVVNEGREAIPYEPFGISKTAYLHKVIYGGEVDVIKGTAKPKNLIHVPYYASSGSVSGGITYTYDNMGRVTCNGENTGTGNSVFYLERGVYIQNYPSGTYYFSQEGFPYQSGTASTVQLTICSKLDSTVKQRIQLYSNTTGKSFTVSENEYINDIFIRIASGKSADFTVNIQLEKGGTGTDFSPYFTPFSFPPISIGTDEGENTLFANEGDSAITYRKETE